MILYLASKDIRNVRLVNLRLKDVCLGNNARSADDCPFHAFFDNIKICGIFPDYSPLSVSLTRVLKAHWKGDTDATEEKISASMASNQVDSQHGSKGSCPP